MYVKLRHIFTFSLLTILSAGSVYAADHPVLKNVEFSGAGGINWINTENTHLVISPVETDSNRITHTPSNGTWKLGVGYSLFLDHLLVELNVYKASNTVKGDVWQFEMPQFDNFRFTAPLSSTRLMLDFKPNLITWNKLTPYLILGTGVTWNTASYTEEADPGINPKGAQSLSEKTRTQLAWDVGAGVSYLLTDELSFSAEYVYAFLGEATPQANTVIIDAPNFSYQIQSLLFGLSLKF